MHHDVVAIAFYGCYISEVACLSVCLSLSVRALMHVCTCETMLLVNGTVMLCGMKQSYLCGTSQPFTGLSETGGFDQKNQRKPWLKHTLAHWQTN